MKITHTGAFPSPSPPYHYCFATKKKPDEPSVLTNNTEGGEKHFCSMLVFVPTSIGNQNCVGILGYNTYHF